MTEADVNDYKQRARIEGLRREHVPQKHEPDFCAGCFETEWPCDVAFLLGVIDQMKAEHLTALATAFLAGGRGKDE